MKTPYKTIGDAHSESALLTSASGHDVARLERLIPCIWPGLEPDSYLTDEEWQATIDLVDAAPTMRARIADLEAALRGMLDWARRVTHKNPGMEIVNALNALRADPSNSTAEEPKFSIACYRSLGSGVSVPDVWTTVESREAAEFHARHLLSIESWDLGCYHGPITIIPENA